MPGRGRASPCSIDDTPASIKNAAYPKILAGRRLADSVTSVDSVHEPRAQRRVRSQFASVAERPHRKIRPRPPEVNGFLHRFARRTPSDQKKNEMDGDD